MKDDKLYAVRTLDSYRVEANSDRTEGRGHLEILGYFEKHLDAVDAAKGQGGMGGSADVHVVRTQVFVNLRFDVELTN